MLGCINPANPDILVVAANAPRQDVTFPTGFNIPEKGKQPPPITPHIANGVAWYFNEDQSYGFAPEGSEIILDECDITADPDRMCVHMVDAWVVYGYSCGSSHRAAVDQWLRVILQTDEEAEDI